MDLLNRLVVALEAIATALNAPINQTSAAVAKPNGVSKPDGPLGGRTYDKEAAHRRQSTVADVSLVSPIVVEQARAASVEFFIDNRKVPWSEAAMKELVAFEAEFEKVHGPGSSEQLPWRIVVPRGEEIKHQ